MLVAQSRHGLILALNANALVDQTYWCPSCHEPVILRHGAHRVAHFAHRRGSHCRLSEGETQEHLLGKMQLYQWAARRGYQPQLEVYLPTIAQRPDLLLRINGRLVALEFQCSPLSLKRLQERNAGYHQLGIQPWWLLGAPYQRHLQSTKIAQFTQLVAGRPALLFWDTKKGCLRIDRSFARRSLTTKKQLTKSTIIQIQTNHLMNFQIHHPALLMRIMGRQITYQLAACPFICHDLQPAWPLMREPVILWRIGIIWHLMQLPPFTFWPYLDWINWLYSKIPVRWLNYGCISSSLLHEHFLYQFTAELVSVRILIQCAHGYLLLQRPVWFNSPAQKLNSLKNNRFSNGFALKY